MGTSADITRAALVLACEFPQHRALVVEIRHYHGAGSEAAVGIDDEKPLARPTPSGISGTQEIIELPQRFLGRVNGAAPLLEIDHFLDGFSQTLLGAVLLGEAARLVHPQQRVR